MDRRTAASRQRAACGFFFFAAGGSTTLVKTPKKKRALLLAALPPDCRAWVVAFAIASALVAFLIRFAARRNSAVLPGLKANCQFEKRVHEIPTDFFSALAVEALLPASGNRSNYSHDLFVDAPRSSRYIAYLWHATIFVLADPYLGSIHRSSPSHCSQSLSIYRPPIISSL
jgi:hypothetical protein